jgi:hypothetical protein
MTFSPPSGMPKSCASRNSITTQNCVYFVRTYPDNSQRKKCPYVSSQFYKVIGTNYLKKQKIDSIPNNIQRDVINIYNNRPKQYNEQKMNNFVLEIIQHGNQVEEAIYASSKSDYGDRGEGYHILHGRFVTGIAPDIWVHISPDFVLKLSENILVPMEIKTAAL